jgi:nitrogen fixation protein NifU and related proteins
MSLSDELYRETILDHYHNPRNQGTMEHPTAEAEGVNPLCGDELTLFINVDEGAIKDIKIKSRGCSINTASGSMMTEMMSGLPIERAQELVGIFKTMMLEKDKEVELPDEMEDLEALKGVRRYPVRIKCALLPWNTMLEAIEQVKHGGGKATPTTTE